MEPRQSQPPVDPELHRRAEARLREQRSNDPLATAAPATVHETLRLVNELQIHQIELEMQNEELQQARAHAESLMDEHAELYEFAPTGYITFDHNGIILRINLNGASLLGVARSRLVNQPFAQFVAEYDQRVLRNFLEQVFSDQSHPSSEVVLLRAGAPPLVVELTGVRSSNGQQCRVALSDVTQRRQAEDQLRASQVETSRLLSISDQSRRVLLNAAEDQQALTKMLANLSARQDAILAAVPEILIEVDTHQLVSWANQAARAFFGEGVLGTNAAALLVGDPAVAESPQPLREDGLPVSYVENWHRRLDGEVRLLACRCRELQDVNGGSIGVLCSASDITEQHQTEQALRQSLHEKDSMLKEIHHRVNNNLQIISSLLRLQAGQIDHPITQGALQEMQNRVRSMALIHEHLYRCNNLAEVNLAAYIQQLCQQLCRAMMVSPETIQLHLDLTPVSLTIDQAIPCGLLVNELVSNALKHAFPDGRAGEVRVELHARTAGPGWRLRVADNGVGLPPDFSLDHLTSLGMKLCSDLTRQMGVQMHIGGGPGAEFVIESY